MDKKDREIIERVEKEHLFISDIKQALRRLLEENERLKIIEEDYNVIYPEIDRLKSAVNWQKKTIEARDKEIDRLKAELEQANDQSKELMSEYHKRVKDIHNLEAELTSLKDKKGYWG